MVEETGEREGSCEVREVLNYKLEYELPYVAESYKESWHFKIKDLIQYSRTLEVIYST